MTNLSRLTFWSCVLAWAATLAIPTAQAQTPSTVTYTVTFKGNWAVAPNGGLAEGVAVVRSAHFTTLVGAVHNDKVTFWASGGMATPGVTSVAELGSTGAFSSEVAAAGSNAVLVRKSIGGSPTVTATFDIEATTERPLFTILSMIGPSPDWFVGVSGLSLLDDQKQWRSSHSVDLFAYDAGTRNREAFQLGGPQTTPQGAITSLKGMGSFSNTQPMARLSFALQGVETNVAPAFTGSTSFSVEENIAMAGTVQATDSDNQDSVTGYAIESGLDGALFSIALSGALTFRAAPDYEDPKDADSDNVYEVRIRATSGAGSRALSTVETFSVTVADINGEAPSEPAAPFVTAVSTFMLRATWTEPANEGPDINGYDYRYRVLHGGEGWAEATSAALSATIDELSPNTTYEVQVRANNAEGSSGWSPSGVGATPVMALGQVTGVSVAAQPEQLLVSWDAVEGATGYKVQWKASGEEYDESARQREVSGGATTMHTISNLVVGLEYAVRVAAIGENMAEGPPSEEVTRTPLPVPRLSFAAPRLVVDEAAGGVNVEVLISPAPPADLEFGYTLSGTATNNLDYAIPNVTTNLGVLLAPAGATEANILVVINDDDLEEEAETVILTLQNNTGRAAGGSEVHIITIEDNDQDPPTSIESAGAEIPASVALQQNYPNPFNPETTIRYGLPEAGDVRLAVYDAAGQEVAVLIDRAQPAGHYAVRFAASHLPSGLYVYRLETGGETMARAMLLVK